MKVLFAHESGSPNMAWLQTPPHFGPAVYAKYSHVGDETGDVVDEWFARYATLHAASLRNAASSPLRTFLSCLRGIRPPSMTMFYGDTN